MFRLCRLIALAWMIALALSLLGGVISAQTQPATRPALDAATEARLTDIDARAGRIKDYTAKFEQKKFTALLRRPLVSTGVVRAAGSVVRWDTEAPEPSVLYVDASEIKAHYPKQNLMEVFPLDKKLADLVTSPIPRLAALRAKFAFESIAPADLGQDAGEPPAGAELVAVKLTPTDEFLRKHVREVRVLLDARSALMLCVVTTDTDGDRTVIRVIEPKLDTGLSADNLKLEPPAGTKVSRPLDALNGGR